MNKIFVVAGVIFLLVLILSAWFFIINLGDFAKFLGEKSIDAIVDDKTKFLGSWITDDNNYFYNFKSDGTFELNNLLGNYFINENKSVNLYFQSNEQIISFLYEFYFSENDTTLELKNIHNPYDVIMLEREK